MRDGAKYDACAAFGRLLPLIRRRVDADLAKPRVTRERALAATVRLLDRAAIRIGNERYARTNDSYGATTLRRDHAEVGTRRIDLRFVGKGGKERDLSLEDARLARAVRRMQELEGEEGEGDEHLFRYEDEEGRVHPVTSFEVNAYLREATGEDFTAKHFRTFHASALAFEKLACGRGRVLLGEMLDHVAAHLGNTPAVVRSSYIHPAVIERIEGQEEWRAALDLPRATRWLSRAERGLIDLLEQSGKAAELLAE